jgi:hypothetical protein
MGFETLVGSLNPIFVDGPLVGQEYHVESTSLVIPVFDSPDIRYRIERFQFVFGDERMEMYLGYSSPLRPGMKTIAEALFRPEIMNRIRRLL